MQRWQERLEGIGRVVLFDYPYVQAGRRAPDRLPTLISAHRDALNAAREGHAGPVFLAGKSMGSRVGCHLALEESVDGLVCFGYPLQGTGKNPKLRDDVLKALTTRVLFLQGTRDRLCPLETLAEVRSAMQAESFLHVVETGDHSLQATKTSLKQAGETQDDVDDRIFEAVRLFIDEGR